MGWTIWVAMGAFYGGLSVVLGAFGAHALKAKLTPEALAIFETGARYQMYHALALIGVGLVATRIDSTALKVSGSALFAGTLIFSGSLYALSLLDIRWMGMVAPIGGLLMIIGWFALAWAVITPAL